MQSWLRTNGTELTLVLLAALLAAAITLSYQLGSTSEAIDRLETDVAGIELKLDAQFHDLKGHIDTGHAELSAQVQRLQIALNASEGDLKSILVGMGTVPSESVFHAAVIDGWIWVFPQADTPGLSYEISTPLPTNSMIRGIRVVEASVISGE